MNGRPARPEEKAMDEKNPPTTADESKSSELEIQRSRWRR